MQVLGLLEGFILISEARLEVVCDQATQLYQQRQTSSLELPNFLKKNPRIGFIWPDAPGTVSCSQELGSGFQTLAHCLVLVGKQRYSNDESVCTPVDFADWLHNFASRLFSCLRTELSILFCLAQKLENVECYPTAPSFCPICRLS